MKRNQGGEQFCDATTFLNLLIQDASSGCSFVPLVGSGLSSPSGIIMGMEFTNYLAFATYLVLSDPHARAKTHGEGFPRRWNLRQQGWPPHPSESEVAQAHEWVYTEFSTLCKKLSLEINPSEEAKGCGPKKVRSLTRKRAGADDLTAALSLPRIPRILASAESDPPDESIRRLLGLMARVNQNASLPTFAAATLVPDLTRSYFQSIVEMGIRALHDWRETLVFLSSVRVEPYSQLLEFSQQDHAVIDDFNTFITRDKQPNLGHKMLAHLSGPLRIQTLLTTNFDTLTEDAFRAMSLAIRVLPVSSRGRLPDARTVAATDSLVKLHGEAQDTRADLTLDEEPSSEDLKTFASYLTQGAGNLLDTPAPQESKRLIVLGYSGWDHRCVQMIKHWLETGPGNPLAYWVCYSDSDKRHVLRLFQEPIYRNRLFVTQSARPDLMLYELYQRLMLSLPPGGLTYEFTHVVPPRRLVDFDSGDEQVGATVAHSTRTHDVVEAVRIQEGSSSSGPANRKLARDAYVDDLRDLIVDVAEGNACFYDPNGRAKEHRSTFSTAVQWRPVYRKPDAKGRHDQKSDEDLLHGIRPAPVIIESPGGVVRACALAVDELSRRGPRKVFWMETQDYMDADAILRDFLRGLAVRFGSFQSRHVTLHPFTEPIRDTYRPALEQGWDEISKRIAKHIKHVLEDYRVDPNQIVTILYGRDSYGGCAGLIPGHWAQSEDPFRALHCLLEAFARAGICVIYLPMTELRSSRKKRMLEKLRDGLPQPLSPLREQSPLADRWSDMRTSLDGWITWPYDPFVGATEVSSDKSRADGKDSVFVDILKDVLADIYQFDDNGRAKPIPFSGGKRAFQKLTFLYSLTLFRHSRHPNAMCGEAVFQCPDRNNQLAIDNDYLRSREAAQWISELRKKRVFFDKPGGSVWMHRDVRMALQYILEMMPLGPGDSSSASSRKPGAGINRHFAEMRSRLHFWIGDWYMKAFCSSGHLMPVIEAIHHRLMAAIYTPFACPKQTDSEYTSPSRSEALTTYQCVLYESSLLEGGKTILTAWKSLKLWQANSFSTTWLGEEHSVRIRKLLKDTVSTLVEPLSEEAKSEMSDRLERATSSFFDLLDALRNELEIEGGNEARAMAIVAGPLATPLFDRSLQNIGEKTTAILQTGWKSLNVSDSEFESTIENSFANAKFADKVLDSFSRISKSDNDESLQGEISAFAILKADWKKAHAGRVRSLHDMVWLLGEYAYANLRRAKILYHATGQIEKPCWIKTTVACNFGIDLCRHLPPSLLSYETQAKVKLHSIYGVALANLGRFFEAKRHLNEAQAILTKSGDNSRAEHAVICLRRAEVLLTECMWIGMFLKKRVEDEPREGESAGRCDKDEFTLNGKELTSNCFKVLLGTDRVFLVDGGPGTPGWSIDTINEIKAARSQAELKNAVIVPPRIADCYRTRESVLADKGVPDVERAQPLLNRMYASTLDEAIALLDQAERNLTGHSQASLWWSRLHTLRLRVYGLLTPLGDRAGASLIFRKRSADMGIYESFRNAIRIAQDDPFRQLRSIKYFFEADGWFARFEQNRHRKENRAYESQLPDSWKLAHESFEELKRNRDLHYPKFAEDLNGSGPADDLKREKPLQCGVWALERWLEERSKES